MNDFERVVTTVIRLWSKIYMIKAILCDKITTKKKKNQINPVKNIES